MFPLVHKAGHAIALDAGREGLIGDAALLAPGSRRQARRSALQNERADGARVVERGVEGQAAAHRIAQPVRGPGGAALQERYEISGDAIYRVAIGIDRGVAAAVAGQVYGDDAEALGQPRPEAAPGGRAAGEAVQKQERLARARLVNGVTQAVDGFVAHAACCSSAGHVSATRRR